MSDHGTSTAPSAATSRSSSTRGAICSAARRRHRRPRVRGSARAERLAARQTPQSQVLRPGVNPLAPKPPMREDAKAKAVISIFCYGGVSQIDTFDPEAGPREVAGRADAGRRPGADDHGQPGRPDAVAVQLQEVRPVGDGRLGAVPAHRAARRRHRVHPLDVRRQSGARAGAVPDEHRQHPGRPSERRQLGDLRPRQREREPARVHRLHRLPRRSDQRAAELEQRLPAGRLPGHADPRHGHRRSSISSRRSIARRTSSASG